MGRNALSGAAVAGATLVVFGGVMLLGNLGFLGDSFTSGGFVRRFWPVILLCVGLWRFAVDGFKLRWKSSALLVLGVGFLLFNLGWWRPNLRLVLPVALIGLGAVVVFTIRKAYRQN
jgi:hypothetical protein